jgi:hypothetical protein
MGQAKKEMDEQETADETHMFMERMMEIHAAKPELTVDQLLAATAEALDEEESDSRFNYLMSKPD